MMKNVANRDGEAVGSVVHVFERAGLGKAPFRFQAMNVNKYQACPGAPVQPGGTCDYCGSSIMFEFFIKSADGKLFKVGSDCVCKTEDAGLRKVVDAKVREQKRLANIERQGFCGQFRLRPPTRWKSFAEWPDGTTSDDTHQTRAHALAVCEMLHREGLGGERTVFPVKTWVTEVAA